MSMSITSFSDIANLADKIGVEDQLYVGSDGKIGTVGGKLGDKTVTVLPQGARTLSSDDFLESLKRSFGAKFADAFAGSFQGSRVPLETRGIKQLVSDVRTRISEEEKGFHADNLKHGLQASDVRVTNAATVDELLEPLLSRLPGAASLVEDRIVKARRQALVDAFDKFTFARSELKGVTGRALAQGDEDAQKTLAFAVETQAALAEALADYTNAVRTALSGLNLATRESDVFDELGKLDDLSMSMELNAAKLERLGDELAELKDDPAFDELASEFAALVTADAPSDADNADAQQAIDDFVGKAEPLLREIAKLDHAPADDETASIVARLGDALETVRDALGTLDRRPGVNPEGLRQLRANLDAADRTLEACRKNLKQHLIEGSVRELTQLMEDVLKRHSDLNGADAADAVELILDSLRQCAKCVKEAPTLDAKIYELEFFDQVLSIHYPDDLKKADPFVEILGLRPFRKKFEALRKLRDNDSIDAPYSRINVRLLGQAFRGEIDLLNYLTLKNAGLTEEMFWAHLRAKKGKKKERLGAGAINTVHTLDMEDVRTGGTRKVVLKDFEVTGGTNRYTVAGKFSGLQHISNTDKVNIATSKAARMIGCGNQVTECGIVLVDGRYQLAQEVAAGTTVYEAVTQEQQKPNVEQPFETNVKTSDKRQGMSFMDGYASLTDVGKRRLKQELLLATAKLEWADLLTGQLDRSLNNMMIKFEVFGPPDDPKIVVELKGIDNDASFAEGYHSFKEIIDQEGNVYDAGAPDDLKTLLRKQWVHSMRRPALLPLSVKSRIQDLDEEEYRREMAAYLSPAALDSAVSRLRAMKKMCVEYEGNGLVVNDLDPNAIPSVKELEEKVRENTKAWLGRYRDEEIAQHYAGNIYTVIFPRKRETHISLRG